ncbi:hypothetical protein F4677DRAFT_451367 [Hypoxylon crocopeplum]|nr:hypothetical protein F4677DRAFT_451367 [Hypoxylon crocopeplum]
MDTTPVNGPATTDIVPYVQERQINVNVDCNELINQVLRTINAYPYYTSQAVAVGKKVVLPSVTAFSVCKTFKTQAVDCSYASGSIAGGISLAIIHGFIDLNPPKEGATTAAPSRRRDLLHEHVGNYLRSTGAEVESVSVRPLMENRDTSVESGHSIDVRGVRELGQEIRTDFRIASRFDGSGDIQTTPFSKDSVVRRASTTAGYKISWEVSGRTGNKPPSQAVTSLGQVVADDWRTRVQAQQNIGDYIGLIDLESCGRIQFRIIPEDGGFGTGFETVDKCNA